MAEYGVATYEPSLEFSSPTRPQLTPCPSGWREVEDEETGFMTCDPYPEGGPHECDEEGVHFPGEPTCSRIGTECPSGDWAENLPTNKTIVYVRSGQPSGLGIKVFA